MNDIPFMPITYTQILFLVSTITLHSLVEKKI